MESATDVAFEKAKLHLVYAAILLAGGLAIAGALDKMTGGVIILVSWLLGIVALHRLGRAGSERAPKSRS